MNPELIPMGLLGAAGLAAKYGPWAGSVVNFMDKWTGKAARTKSNIEKLVKGNKTQRYPRFSRRRYFKRPQDQYSFKEHKSLDLNIDTVLSITNMADNKEITLLNPVQRGTAPSQRDGRKILMRKICLKGNLYLTYPERSSTYSQQNFTFRISIVYDILPGDNFPNKSEIFRNTGADDTKTSTWRSMPNLDNQDRFFIIYDDIIKLEPNWIANKSLSEGRFRNQVSLPFNYERALKHTTTFNSTANPVTSANIGTGGLYFIITWAPSATSNDDPGTVQVALTSRLTFID